MPTNNIYKESKMSEQMSGMDQEESSQPKDEESLEQEGKEGSITGTIKNVRNFESKEYNTLKVATILVNQWSPGNLLTRKDFHQIDVVVTFDQASEFRPNEDPTQITLDITDKSGLEGATWVSQEVINSIPKE